MESHQQRQQNTAYQQVKAFIRINGSKKGTDFTCHSPIEESELVKILFHAIQTNKFLKAACQDFINSIQFVLQGHHINTHSSQQMSLRPYSIIHLINTKNTTKQFIPITFRYQNPQKNQDISYSVEAKVNSTIEDQAEKINSLYFGKFMHQVTFVYLGAQLSPLNTFEQAGIEQNSEIIVIDKLRNDRNQVDAFESAQEIPLQGFEFKPRTIKVPENKQLYIMGLNMPCNSKISKSKVKKLLEEHQIQNELFIEQQNVFPLQNHSVVPQDPVESQSIENQTSDIIPKQNFQQKIDQEQNIPTNEEIEAGNQVEKMEKQ